MTALASHFQSCARYNRWANGRLFAACGQLSETAYMQPRPAFFGSIHGALNHILVGDRIWLGRAAGQDSGIHSLDQQLYGDFLGLKVAREAEDARIVGFIDGLKEDEFAEVVVYRTMAGEPYRNRLAEILAHLFNHQTHHRGQVHDLLSQTEVPPPPLDYIIFLREGAF